MRRRWPRWLALCATAAAAAVVLLLGAAALGAGQVLAARTAAAEVEARLRAGDGEAAAAALRDLQQHTAGVGRWLGGAPWTWLEWVPWAGDGVTAMVEVAAAVDAVATPLAGGLAEVVQVSGAGSEQVAAAMGDQTEALIAAGREAVQRSPGVAALETSSLPPLVGDAIAAAQEQFADLAQLATGTAAGSVLIPGLLGSDEPTPWLLVASQPAEARGSGGGFFGAVAAMRGSDGAARLVAVHPNNEFFDEAADLSQLPPEFARLWGEPAAYVWGHNLTRHFPYAAALLHQTSSSVAPPARYIVAIDPSVVAALLKLTGPVTAAGVTIDARSAESYLTRGVYRDFPRGAEKDRAVSQLLAAAFEQLQSTTIDPVDLARVLAEPVRQQRLVAWAADPAEQEVLAWTPLAGGLPSGDMQVTAAINNAAGNKLDAYVDSDIAMTLTGECNGPSAGSVAVTLRLAEIPAGLPDYAVAGVRGPDTYGGTRLLVHVYAPPGARLLSFSVDGAAGLPIEGVEMGRPVWGTALDLLPGQARTVTAQFAGNWPDTMAEIVPQAMVRPTSVGVNDLRSCPSSP